LSSTTAAPPRIDPRLRARRVAVQRDVGRKRLRRLLAVLMALAVLGAAWGVTRTPVLDVDHVRVTGAGHTGDQAVVAAAGIDRGDPLLTARLGRAARRIAALPWVQTVQLRREWPGTVKVTVVERTPIAALPTKDNRWVLVDAQARQLVVTEQFDRALVRIDGDPIAAEPGTELKGRTSAALQVAASIPATLRERVIALRPAAAGTVEGTVQLRDGSEAWLRFGTPAQTAAKWLALLSVLDEADPAGLAGIDVRVPAAPALTRR
jgi:cell division protein FtsQ